LKWRAQKPLWAAAGAKGAAYHDAMKIFVSSIIAGMEALRAAAKEAIDLLGHEAIMAEDLGAQPHSPQVACLSGLRQSGAVVLIVGAEYGAKQASGLSATHEEYNEARDNRPTFVFVQAGVSRAPDQLLFLRDVEHWQKGVFRGTFTTPEQLRKAIAQAPAQLGCRAGHGAP
jgi:Domain of unknown function (DUF4062)